MPKSTANQGAAKPLSKAVQVISLLQHKDGGSLAEIIATTNWKPHSACAAISGFKKKGYAVTREKVDGTSRYFISGGTGQ